MIQWEVRIGDLMVMASMVGTILIYVFRSGRYAETVLVMQREISELKYTMQTFAAVLTDLAVQKTRLDTQAERLNIIDRRVDDMRRSADLNQGLRGLDREYPPVLK